MKKVDRKLFCWVSSLAFLGGALNAYAIFQFSLTASHVTGSLTKIFMDLGKFDFSDLKPLAFIVCSFFFGSILSGAIVGMGRDFELRKRYGDTIIFIGIFLKLIEILLYNRGELVYFISFFLGLQNGLFIRYKGIVIRTTHMTGTVTDLGVVIGHCLRGSFETKWKLKYYFSNILSFCVGAFIVSFLFIPLGRGIFNFLSIAYILSGIYYFLIRHRYYKLKK